MSNYRRFQAGAGGWLVGLTLTAATAFAHAPLESSTRAIALDHTVELALTVGLEGGAILLKGAPPEASQVRPVGPGFALPQEFGARWFEVSSGGAAVSPSKVSVRMDGLEFNFVVEYPRPKSGRLASRAAYVDQLPPTLKSGFVLTDENGNISATRILKPGDTAFEVTLPGNPVIAYGAVEPTPPVGAPPVIHIAPQMMMAPPVPEIAPRRSAVLRWPLLLALAAGLGVGWRWRRQRTRCGPSPHIS